MLKEEVTLRNKFTMWNVYQRNGKSFTRSVEQTPPMTPQEALKHFKARAVSAILN